MVISRYGHAVFIFELTYPRIFVKVRVTEHWNDIPQLVLFHILDELVLVWFVVFQILEDFLTRLPLFSTQLFQKQYEEQAKSNLTGEIGRLRDNSIPVWSCGRRFRLYVYREQTLEDFLTRLLYSVPSYFRANMKNNSPTSSVPLWSCGGGFRLYYEKSISEAIWWTIRRLGVGQLPCDLVEKVFY